MDTNGTHLNTAVVQRVGTAMTLRGYSQKKLAEATGIPRVTLTRRLAGSVPFNVNEIAAIADALGYPLSYFLADDDQDGAA
jgi:transcriptional regulator with XRE-family HTH domain